MSQYLYISWERFHLDTQALAEKLMPLGPFQKMVAITRGGLAPAALLSQILDIRLVETVCLASYTKDETQESLQVLKAHADEGDKILVVDDLADSGKTAQFVRHMFPQAHMAVLYIKPEGLSSVDSFVHKVPQERWIVFPWEESASQAKTWPTDVF